MKECNDSEIDCILFLTKKKMRYATTLPVKYIPEAEVFKIYTNKLMEFHF